MEKSSTTKISDEIEKEATVPDSIQQGAAAAAVLKAASPASDEAATRSEEKGPTSPAGRRILRAIAFVLMAVVAVVGPILSLVSFPGLPLSQVQIISGSICFYVLVFLRCIWRDRWFFSDCVRLSYGPLLAFYLATLIGSATATFVLFFSTVWAAGNLGYSLAVHRLVKGTEPAIHTLPCPSFPTKDSVKELNFNIYIGAPFAVLVWTLLMTMIINIATVTDELEILFILSYFGWIHAAVWVIFVAQLPVHGVLLEEQMPRLLPALVPWMIISPAISFISLILSVLCHLLLMMALVAFLWYNLAIYKHFLETATPSTTTRGNEDGEKASEAAATPLSS